VRLFVIIQALILLLFYQVPDWPSFYWWHWAVM